MISHRSGPCAAKSCDLPARSRPPACPATTQATPAQVGTDTWKTIKTGYFNACGIRSDNALLCWGNDPVTNMSLQYDDTPQQIGTAIDWQMISMSSDSIIGLRAGGTAYAWGFNGTGQLGLPPANDIQQPTPLGDMVAGWSEVSSGIEHSCGIANGHAYCWGAIGDGNLGNGASTTFYSPTKIGSDSWTTLAGGPGLCGLRSDAALMCWGYNQIVGIASTGIGFGNTDPVWAPTRLGTDIRAQLDAAWVVQQLREAFPFDTSPRHLIFDRDGTFSTHVVSTVKRDHGPQNTFTRLNATSSSVVPWLHWARYGAAHWASAFAAAHTVVAACVAQDERLAGSVQAAHADAMHASLAASFAPQPEAEGSPDRAPTQPAMFSPWVLPLWS